MKTLFVCKHNLGRSQMARALYNNLTGTDDATSAGTVADMYKEKIMGDFDEETRAMKAMRGIGLDLTDAPRKQLTPKLVQNIEQIISFVPRTDLPQWLQNDTRVVIWHLKNYPAPDFATVQRQRDEIATKVRNLVK
jgi:protein-tyrosine-phosphatase